ncbi:hypothetical protein LP417_35590 (plasmid) [Polaromonas sp. P1-6]|nr:hypothetical protein LP417_35590 [Polaromonas sp. P1-6]
MHLWLGEVDGVPVDSLMAADALRGHQEILPVWEQNAAGAKVVVTMDSGAVTHAFSNLPGIEVVVHDSDTLERDGFNQVRRKDILDKSTVACEPIVFMDSFSAVKGLA